MLLNFLFLTVLITCIHASKVIVSVGGLKGENIFVPQIIHARVNDQIIFSWVSGSHSVVESDLPRSCAKSAKADAFTSGGEFTAPNKTMVLLATDIGIKYFYCDVPGHCENGMYGTIIISDDLLTLTPTLEVSSAGPESTLINDNGSPLYFESAQTPIIIIGTLVGAGVLIIVG
ncbi:17119_t:CDS:2, partial [Rhizophagus irregularis]